MPKKLFCLTTLPNWTNGMPIDDYVERTVKKADEN